MKTQFTSLLTKITWVLFLGISTIEWSCLEDINPREIPPSKKIIPTQPDRVDCTPIIETPGRSKTGDRLPVTIQIKQ